MIERKTKRCGGAHGCGKIKPISEFYQNPGGYYQTMCKSCTVAYTAKRKKQASKPPQHEQDFVAECCRRGIIADHGKHYRKFSYVDIVCFGAVRVELKLAQMNEAYPLFKFTVSQSDRGILADVVVLMMPHDNSYTYHFFNPKFHKFYNMRNGKKSLKTAVSYIENPSQHRSVFKSLNKLDMANAQDQWHLLYPESIRHFVAGQYANNTPVPKQLTLKLS